MLQDVVAAAAEIAAAVEIAVAAAAAAASVFDVPASELAFAPASSAFASSSRAELDLHSSLQLVAPPPPSWPFAAVVVVDEEGVHRMAAVAAESIAVVEGELAAQRRSWV